MKIVKTPANPSREDAVRMTRNEKSGILVLCHAAGALEDLQTEMAGRVAMVRDGPARLKKIAEETDELLNDIRLTVPWEQRIHLQNTAMDYEMRLAPKAQPSKTNVLVTKEEFRELVDAARAKCVDCSETDETCERCRLFQMLTVYLPLEDYHDGLLCPYNLKGWAN